VLSIERGTDIPSKKHIYTQLWRFSKFGAIMIYGCFCFSAYKANGLISEVSQPIVLRVPCITKFAVSPDASLYYIVLAVGISSEGAVWEPQYGDPTATNLITVFKEYHLCSIEFSNRTSQRSLVWIKTEPQRYNPARCCFGTWPF
jgi:hypothetical protein